MIAIVAGFTAGFVHVLSGPDHLAAIAPLSFDKQNRGWLAGMQWGLGHTGGVLLVGGVAVSLRETLPLDAFSAVSERLVGIALIWIGLWGLRKAFLNVGHIHEHGHDTASHTHIHLHETKTTHKKQYSHAHTHAAFAVGTLHGLAGSAHLLGVLPALALPLYSAVLYLAFFGVGSILAMTGFAWATGLFSSRVKNIKKAYRYSLAGLSSVSIVVGCVWLAI
ncbi:Nickel transporter UreH [hydrothermal vent metagenome]|uniref:Nickel transporter UreH n=1 Tax=hydrothermal vent metagenome TaxID=652676 RepID=A0A3B1BM97_9ZZZZ